MTLPNLLDESQWSPERVKFRRKCINACVQENLDLMKEIPSKKSIGDLMFEMCEECFLMGEAFGGQVLTDEEVEQVNRNAMEKIQSMEQ